GFLSLPSAMEQIVLGTIDPNAAPKFQFEHAAVLLADSLGERLDATFFEDTRTALWDEVDSVISARQANDSGAASSWPTLSQVLDRGPLLKVPLDSSMPLGTGYLTKLEVAQAWEAAENLDLESEEGLPELEWTDEALEGARVYRQWLEQTTRGDLGLFLHC
ncbi:MAG: hypothetical protein ACREA0_25535, partial [bacterium]